MAPRSLVVITLHAVPVLGACGLGGSVARWDDALAAAEPVLESVRIGP